MRTDIKAYNTEAPHQKYRLGRSVIYNGGKGWWKGLEHVITTSLEKSFSFGILCVPLVNVYPFVCASFPYGFESVIFDLI